MRLFIKRRFERESIFAKFETRLPNEHYAFISANVFNEKNFDNYNRTGFFVRDYSDVTASTGLVNADATGNDLAAEVSFIDYFYNRETVLWAGGLRLKIGQ